MLKYFRHKRKKGQSTLEYAVLMIIIIGALLTVQVYIKRGVQGRLKQASDDIGDQYSDGNTNVSRTVVSHSKSQDQFGGLALGQGVSRSKLIDQETSNVTLSSNIINTEQEFWGKKQP